VIATNTNTATIVVLLVVLVVPGVICALKGRWGFFWTGAVIFLLAAASASAIFVPLGHDHRLSATVRLSNGHAVGIPACFHA
jgi:hypothetical protein